MIDLHSHILPSLDDGAQSVEDAIEMCAIAAHDGITTVVATPHMLCNIGNANVDRIREAGESLKEILKSRGVEIELMWAAEVRMVEDLPRRIKANEIPMLDSAGRYLLLEPPLTGGNSEHLCQVIFELQLDDIVPVIAHPERCEMFAKNFSLAQRVIDQGALLQVNAGGIVQDVANGGLGPVITWLRNGLVHVVASDAHDTVRRPPLLLEAARLCQELVGAKEAKRLFYSNPANILGMEIS